MLRTFKSPAKLNLFLHVVGQKENGYHELQTFFQLIDFCDELTFEPNTIGDIRLLVAEAPIFEKEGVGAGVDSQASMLLTLKPADNLVVRAAHLLKKTYGCQKGCTISLYKRIPVGSGLGGGSSNAATTLLALNVLWGLHRTKAELVALALQLGADVPFFVYGYPAAFAEGVGEVLFPQEMPLRWYLVLVPPCAVSTKEIFSHKELTRNTERMTIRAFKLGVGRNDCEPLVSQLYPPVRSALCWLSERGDARLTGTGCGVFCAFECEAHARARLKEWQGPGCSFVAPSLQVSPLYDHV
jgi:4-diphosphocytidyl-2-C-methyl-D-erythritol kinase